MPTEVNSRVTMCPWKIRAAFDSRLPQALERQDPGSLPPQATLLSPKQETVMRCQNVS